MTDPPPTRTVVLIGVSGCGKSTVMRGIVERLGWPWAEADDFHSPANIEKMTSGHALTDEDRWPWLEAIAAWIGEREAARENGVATCSALRRAYRDHLRHGHPSVQFVHLVVDRAVLEARLARRHDHYMPPSLLGSQLGTLESFEPDEPGFTVSGELPLARILDEIDARLGLTRGDT